MDDLKIRQLNSIIQGNKIFNPKPIQKHIQTPNQKSFEEIFQNIQENDELKFSKHAKERIESRKIELGIEDVNQIKKALSQAKLKGVNTALILMNDTAFIANIKNNTIITTVTKDQLKENVFTNIDGAVII